ncbi:CTP synthase, partial [Frankliniella fusca]
LIGAAIVGITAHYGSNYYHNYLTQTPEIFLCIVATTFLVGTACLLLSCILSISTASILPKTIFEVIYHSVAFILYLAASINFLVEVNQMKKNYGYKYEPYLAAAVSMRSGPRQHLRRMRPLRSRPPRRRRTRAQTVQTPQASILHADLRSGEPLQQGIPPADGWSIDAESCCQEMVFGVVCLVLMLSASLNMLQKIRGRNMGHAIVEKGYNSKVFAAILGLINTVLYLLSTFLAYRSYKGK